MSKFESILKSFHSKDNLNSKIWKEGANDITINPKVRKKLLEISNEFIEFLKVDVVVSDIIMTGSLANYNWSEFSDIDLHIVVDFGQFSKEQLPLYEELFRLKKTLFNEKHDITIYGYEVELYVQNESESHFSSGVFSVLNDEWIVEPKKEDVKIDIGLIKNKAEQWMKIIDGVIENASDEPLDEAKKIISKYKDKLKKYRTCGLESGGEYSDENLVFKILRRNNYIQKLFDFETTIADKELSLNESRIKKLIREGSKDSLNSSVLKALQSVETTYGVKITDDNVNDELAQEKQIYPDNSGIDSSALSELKKLLSDLYSKFPNAPEDSNSNCDGVKGCVSGYRGYSTQVKTFGSKISRDGGVSNRQKFSALPGFSQHHTGKGFDILSVEPSWWNKNSDIKSWVANNVCKYGFKVSYPTQGVLRSAEPWHLFYTGQFCGGDKEEKTPETTKTVEKEKTPETIKTESGDLISDITNFSKSSRTLTNLKKEGGRLSFNLEAQNLQKALQFLKYSLPKWGTDGKFGNETESALMKFESSNGLEEDGKFDSEDAEVLVKKLISSGYKKTDNQQIQVTPTEVEKDKVVATTTNDDEYVVLTPENYQGKNVHVLFGGSHTSGYSKNSFKTEAIQKYGNILKPYATNTIIVVTHHMNTVSNVQKYVSEKYGANVTSLAGFSQGGKEAWRHASDGSFKLVGLIDPSTYQTDVQFGSGTYLYCDPKNWGTTGFYGETRRKLEWYCENKEKYSGRVTCFNKGGWHMNFGILKSFYDTYGSMI